MKQMTPEANMVNLTLFDKIVSLLNSQGVQYRVITHESIDGSAESSSALSGTNPEQGAKSLIMIVDGKNPIMVVLRGTDRIDKPAIKKLTGSKDVRLATLDEVQKVARAEVGTLPCIGNLFNLSTYVDQNLLKEKEIAFGTGLRTKTIVIKTEDFQKIANPLVGSFVKN